MAEPRLLLRNMNREEIAYSKFGVMWRLRPHTRIGDFGNGGIYDNDRKLLGLLQGTAVLSATGESLGEIYRREEADDVLYTLDLSVDGRIVGQVFGDEMMAAAGIVFFRNELLDCLSD